MRVLPFIVLVAILFGCGKEEPVVALDTREPIATNYVGAPELQVRQQPNETAAVVTTFQNGESVSILQRQGEWVEVRTAMSSGWAKAADLVDAQKATAEEENLTPKYRIPPATVTAPGIHGEIYIEADVNTDGDVTGTRLIVNTTGSESLGARNMAALQAAKFHPIVQKGERKPFKYYHRVTY